MLITRSFVFSKNRTFFAFRFPSFFSLCNFAGEAAIKAVSMLEHKAARTMRTVIAKKVNQIIICLCLGDNSNVVD